MKLDIEIKSTESALHKNSFIEAASLLNKCHFDEAEQQLQDILKLIGDSQDYFKFLVQYWVAKTNYQKGDFTKALTTIQNIQADLKNIHEELAQDVPLLSSIRVEAAYIYLKSSLLEAKILNKIKDFVKSEQISDKIISSIKKELDEEPKEYWKYAIKAAYLKSKQMQICMEYRTSKNHLEQDAKPILLKLISKFYKDQGEDQEKVELPKNSFTFEYRKKYAHFLKKFAFYEDAFNQLKQILEEELEYYQLKRDQEGEEQKSEEQKLSLILPNMSNADNYFKENKYILKPSSIPHLKVKQTYYQIAKILAFQLKTQQSHEVLKVVEDIVTTVYQERRLLQVAQIHNCIKDAYLKETSNRSLDCLSQSENFAKSVCEINDKILDESKANYIIAKGLVGLGEVILEKKSFEDAEKLFLRAQIMIGEKFGDNHPCIMPFNANLVEAYQAQEDQEKKQKSVLIVEKNLEIAKQYYGELSIYTAKYELAAASNSISNYKVKEASDHVSQLRQIVQAFHGDDPKQLMNQFLFLGQILIAMTMMNGDTADSAERILTYVFQKQLEYVEFNKSHPFLEQTVFNLAILYRSNQQLRLSLQMWEYLRRIQESLYGENKEVLIYTYKNIGVCYLGLQVPDKAEEYYKKALDIMEQLKKDSVQVGEKNEEQEKDDLEQMATIYFNLYLSAVSDDQKDKAKEYNLKNMEFNVKLHGERSLNVSNNCFIQAQLCLKTNQIDEAVNLMQRAIDIFDCLRDQKYSQSDLKLIKVRYLLSMSNIYYIKENFSESQRFAEEAQLLCKDFKHVVYDTMAEVEKLGKEAESIIIKSKAKLLHQSALDMRPKEMELVVASNTKMLPLAGIFVGTSSTAFLTSMLYFKHQF